MQKRPYNIHVRAFDAHEILIFAYVNLTSKNDDNNWQAVFAGPSKKRKKEERKKCEKTSFFSLDCIKAMVENHRCQTKFIGSIPANRVNRRCWSRPPQKFTFTTDVSRNVAISNSWGHGGAIFHSGRTIHPGQPVKQTVLRTELQAHELHRNVHELRGR